VGSETYCGSSSARCFTPRSTTTSSRVCAPRRMTAGRSATRASGSRSRRPSCRAPAEGAKTGCFRIIGEIVGCHRNSGSFFSTLSVSVPLIVLSWHRQPGRRGIMSNDSSAYGIEGIASELREMARSAIASNAAPFELRRVLRFVSQVVQVVDQCFANVFGLLIELRYLTADDLTQGRHRALLKELELVVSNSYFRNSLEVCSRLRYLEQMYQQSIEPIVRKKGLDTAAWGAVLRLLNEHEGAIVRTLQETVSDFSDSLESLTPSLLPPLHARAAERAAHLKEALSELRSLEGRILGLSGNEGLLELSASANSDGMNISFNTHIVNDSRKGQFMGDTFSGIQNASINNRSIVNESSVEIAVNKVRGEAGDGTAEALGKIADAVRTSGNTQAAEFLDQLNEELGKPQPRKGLLRASWDNLVKTLPAVTAIAGAAGAIAKLFS
jgi:hypothetical protein